MKKSIYSLLFMAMAVLTFCSCEDVPAPYNTPQVVTPDTDSDATPAGTGTKDDPYNVAAVIQYCKSLGSSVESDKDVYIKGIVTQVKEQYSANYGNVTVYIADNVSGTEFYVYRALYFNNKKWTTGDKELKAGDEVVFCGKVMNYSGNTPETVQSKAWLYSLNGETADGGSTTPDGGETKGTGTAADPFNSVAAQKYTEALTADAATEQEFYIKGKIQKIADNGEFSASYGNASFYIADDENSEQFYIFRTYYFGGEKWKEGNTQIKVGDEVVVCAKLINYKGNTPETNQGGKLISLNGKTSDDGSDTTPDTPSSGNISIDGTTVTMTNSGVTAGESIKVDKISDITSDANPSKITLSDGTVLTLDINGGTTKPAYNSNYNNLRIYAQNKMTITASKQIAKIVLNCDSYSGTNYVGNETATVEFSGNTATYTNVFTGTSGGGVQLRILSFEIFYAK